MLIEDFDFRSLKQEYITQIESCDWSAAKFLAKTLREGKLSQTLGGWAKLYLLTDNNTVVSFVTLSCQDCVNDVSLTPWLGFLFTKEEYRNRGYAKQVVDFALQKAKETGYDKAYLATDHVGLYEKYGFKYVETRIDIYNEQSRIYVKNL